MNDNEIPLPPSPRTPTRFAVFTAFFQDTIKMGLKDFAQFESELSPSERAMFLNGGLRDALLGIQGAIFYWASLMAIGAEPEGSPETESEFLVMAGDSLSRCFPDRGDAGRVQAHLKNAMRPMAAVLFEEFGDGSGAKIGATINSLCGKLAFNIDSSDKRQLEGLPEGAVRLLVKSMILHAQMMAQIGSTTTFLSDYYRRLALPKFPGNGPWIVYGLPLYTPGKEEPGEPWGLPTLRCYCGVVLGFAEKGPLGAFKMQCLNCRKFWLSFNAYCAACDLEIPVTDSGQAINCFKCNRPLREKVESDRLLPIAVIVGIVIFGKFILKFLGN